MAKPKILKKRGATTRRNQGNRLPKKHVEGVVTHEQLAQEVGLTSSAISYKIRRGMSVAQIREEGKRRGIAVANGTATAKQLQAGQPKRRVAAKPDEELHNASTRKEIALANLKELEEAQKRGELVPLESVTKWVGEVFIKAKDIWSGVRDLADRVRHEPDVVAAQLMIDAEVKRGLEELQRFAELAAGKLGEEEG